MKKWKIFKILKRANYVSLPKSSKTNPIINKLIILEKLKKLKKRRKLL